MTAIKAICFDMDGLLFNTEDLFDDVSVELLRRRNRRFDPALIKRMMGLQAKLALQLFIDHYELSDTLDDLQRETEGIFHSLLPTRLTLMPGALELLERLSRCGQRPLALTTSSGRASVDRIMAIHDIRAHFSFCLTAEDVINSKPHPEIYQTAAQRFGVTTAETLVFEDSENGCKAAVAAGAHVVAVPSKHASLHCYDGARMVVNSLRDAQIENLLTPT